MGRRGDQGLGPVDLPLRLPLGNIKSKLRLRAWSSEEEVKSEGIYFCVLYRKLKLWVKMCSSRKRNMSI